MSKSISVSCHANRRTMNHEIPFYLWRDCFRDSHDWSCLGKSVLPRQHSSANHLATYPALAFLVLVQLAHPGWLSPRRRPRRRPMKRPVVKDTDPMPFGQYKGKPMQDVPARYLHYLWTNGLKEKDDPVSSYIRERLDALKLEYPDGIWS